MRGVVDLANAGFVEQAEGEGQERFPATPRMKAHIWDDSGNRHIEIEVFVGDRVEWKRNGYLGTVFGTLLGRSPGGSRLSLRLEDGRRTAVKPWLCAVWRDGKRIYS